MKPAAARRGQARGGTAPPDRGWNDQHVPPALNFSVGPLGPAHSAIFFSVLRSG